MQFANSCNLIFEYIHKKFRFMHTNTFCKYRKKLLASPRVHLVSLALESQNAKIKKLPILSVIIYLRKQILIFKAITEEEIGNIINSLKPKVSSGIESIECLR